MDPKIWIHGLESEVNYTNVVRVENRHKSYFEPEKISAVQKFSGNVQHWLLLTIPIHNW